MSAMLHFIREARLSFAKLILWWCISVLDWRHLAALIKECRMMGHGAMFTGLQAVTYSRPLVHRVLIISDDSSLGSWKMGPFLRKYRHIKFYACNSIFLRDALQADVNPKKTLTRKIIPLVSAWTLEMSSKWFPFWSMEKSSLNWVNTFNAQIKIQ